MLEKRIEIRWRDVDAYGHVNNAVYLTYLEEARDAWVEQVLGPISSTWDFVLARLAIDFKAELIQDDRAVLARCRLVSIGRSSIQTREQICKQDGSISAAAESVLVPRDPSTSRARRLTEAERSALEADLASP